ncbi:MAG: hypothetical protein AVDCRST_MAG64-235, partial [uncultured Phycisphaerae bacterium]
CRSRFASRCARSLPPRLPRCCWS